MLGKEREKSWAQDLDMEKRSYADCPPHSLIHSLIHSFKKPLLSPLGTGITISSERFFRCPALSQ